MTQRLMLKVAAVVFSLVLWLRVSSVEISEDQANVRLVLRPDSGLVAEQPRQAVIASVAGTPSELLRLRADPPVLTQPITADAPDTVRLELDPRNLDLHGIRVSVRNLEPRQIEVALTRMATRMVPVRSALQLRAAAGVRITGDPVFEPESVAVAGAADKVRPLDAIWTLPLELVVSDSAAVTVPLDTSAVRIHVQPAVVRVRVPTEPLPHAPLDSQPPSRSPGSAPPPRSKTPRQ